MNRTLPKIISNMKCLHQILPTFLIQPAQPRICLVSKFLQIYKSSSLREALIFTSINPKYDDRFSVNYKFITKKIKVA